MSELIALEAEDDRSNGVERGADFPPQRWPQSAALIRRECPDMCAVLQLILLSEFPVGIRESMAFALDVLTEVVHALPPVTDGPGSPKVAHVTGELPARWGAGQG